MPGTTKDEGNAAVVVQIEGDAPEKAVTNPVFRGKFFMS